MVFLHETSRPAPFLPPHAWALCNRGVAAAGDEGLDVAASPGPNQWPCNRNRLIGGVCTICKACVREYLHIEHGGFIHLKMMDFDDHGV